MLFGPVLCLLQELACQIGVSRKDVDVDVGSAVVGDLNRIPVLPALYLHLEAYGELPADVRVLHRLGDRAVAEDLPGSQREDDLTPVASEFEPLSDRGADLLVLSLFPLL